MKSLNDEGIVQLNGVSLPIIIHNNKFYRIGQCAHAHMHDYIEMLYCYDGNFEIWLNGKYFQFGKGDLVVINSRETHRICSPTENGGAYICARFLPEMLYTSTMTAFDFRYVMPFILNNSKHQRIFKKSEIENTFIPAIMEEVLNEYSKKDFGYELAVKTDIARIFLWIIRYWHNLNVNLSYDVELNDEMIELMETALDFISKNYTDDIKAYEVARICNLSYSYFSRIFKKYMKKSFSEYLNYIRITNAEKLLTSTNDSVTEIAVKCGFTTSSYFIQQFKQQRGISPKQFRKNLVQS